MKTFKVAFDHDWPLHRYMQQVKLHLSMNSVEVIRPKSRIEWFSIEAFHMHAPHYHWLGWRLSSYRASVLLVRFIMKLLVLKGFGKRLIWTAHDLFDHGDSEGERNPQLFNVGIYLISLLSDAIVCHCEAAKKELCEKFRVSPHKVQVTPHPNFIDMYPSQTTREQARKKLGLSEDHRVFLVLGYIRGNKGILNLIRAFRNLNDNNALLLIAGQAQVPDTCKAILQESEQDSRIHTHFHYIADDEVQFFMAAADYAVFPYERITTSGTLILAMGFRKACIASDVCCLGELVSEKGGFKFNTSDSQELLSVLKEASASSPEAIESMGKWNLNLVSDWSWSNLAQLYRELYQGASSKNTLK